MEIHEDMKRRKRAFKPIRTKIDDWIAKHKNLNVTKMLKIMIVDHSLEFMREIEGRIEDFPYSLNVQTKLTHEYYQIERSLPHIIVIKEDDEFNTSEVTNEIIQKVKAIKDYKPYILVFNTQDYKELNQKKIYKNSLYHPGPVDIETIREMAKMVDRKYKISKVNDKVFPSSHDQYSLIFAKREVKVLKLNESVMYINSKVEIPMWTSFFVQKPIPMMFTVVPHKDDDEFKNIDHAYRCLINAVGESEKAHLRRAINASIGRHQVD